MTKFLPYFGILFGLSLLPRELLLHTVAFVGMVILVVSVHEFGHYLVARYFKVRVIRFSVGFGPALGLITDKAGTEWVLAPIPLGGYVRMLDEETAKEQKLDMSECLESKRNWQQFLIYAAGPVANLLLSMAILTGVYIAGEEGFPAKVGVVVQGSPAEEAGLTTGDVITDINGRHIALWKQAYDVITDAVLSNEKLVMQTSAGVLEIPAGAVVPADMENRAIASEVGFYPDVTYITQTIEAISPDSPAEWSGLKAGDVLVAIGDEVLDDWVHTSNAIRSRANATEPVVLWRDNAPLTLTVTFVKSNPSKGVYIGYLGIVPSVNYERFSAMRITVNHTPFSAASKAFKKTTADVTRTFQFVRHMLAGGLSFNKSVSGPVGIAKGAGGAATSGWKTWWQFVALISVSLAVVNLLPLPVLDGGRMLVCVIQFFIARRLPAGASLWLDRIGIMCVLVIIISALVADFSKL